MLGSAEIRVKKAGNNTGRCPEEVGPECHNADKSESKAATEQNCACKGVNCVEFGRVALKKAFRATQHAIHLCDFLIVDMAQLLLQSDRVNCCVAMTQLGNSAPGSKPVPAQNAKVFSGSHAHRLMIHEVLTHIQVPITKKRLAISYWGLNFNNLHF